MSEHVKQLPKYHNLTAETADIFRGVEARLTESSKASSDRIEKLEAALREVAKINNQRDRFSADIDAIIINALGEQNDDA